MSALASLLLVDDDDAFRHVLVGELGNLDLNTETAKSGAEGVRKAISIQPEIVLLDLQLPDMSGLEVLKVIRERSPATEVIMLTGHGSIDTAIASMRIGAFDYVAKPCPIDELEVRIQRAVEKHALQQRADLLERGLTPSDPSHSFLGESPAFLRTVKLIERAAPSDSVVLFCGETGTGKEVAAKLLHARSPRKNRPFVVVECAALQENLLQSELFGHERGAFTGADRAKPGLFEVADRGSIFLDEIGEVSEATQISLLRVLESSSFRRVGGTVETRVDVRVIAATLRHLPTLVGQGRFREDLYYRLSTITIELPPLRERTNDMELLANHFTARFNTRYGCTKRIGDAAMEVLRLHSWPGNLRELLHVIESAMAVCEGTEILPSHLPASLQPASVAHAAVAGEAARRDEEASGRLPTLQEVERAHIERVLRAAGGHRGEAARILGISERNLYRKLQEYGRLS